MDLIMDKSLNPDDFAALIGIDWADKKHDICLVDQATQDIEYSVISHTPKSLDDWAQSLAIRFNYQPIAIALELKSGPLVYALLKYPFFTLVPIAPRALAKYREAFTQSGAKDDPTDAFLCMDFLSRHADKLEPIQPDTKHTRHIQQLVEHRRALVADRVRLTNRITASLKLYYPQALEWFEDKGTLLFCDFIERWPDVKSAKKARKTTLEAFFHDHNSRYPEVIEQRIHAIKSAVPLTLDEGVILPNKQYVSLQIRMLRELIIGIKQYDETIAAEFKQHQDYELFSSFPGAGPAFAPRLLAAMGSNRNRFQSSDELARQIGVAPVMERSGKKSWVHWRYACPKFVRQTFVEWAGYSLRSSYWAKQYYDIQRAKGKHHNAVLRALAFKWARIIYRCWKNKEPYDEAKYLLSLKAKGSPLLS